MSETTSSSRTPTDSFLDYSPRADRIDEAIDKNGQVHASWQYLLTSLSGLGAEELSHRQKKALRILRDDGASYNVYDQSSKDSTWLLDLIPFLIDSTEWLQIEAGLQERSELFNLILKDLYSERELITRGIIPPELVFGHKSFLRNCQNIKLPGEHQLIVHAADMIRQPDGNMCLLADRTQAPSGAGYALENRTVMSRVLPSLFRDSHVHRLANYFQLLRQKLINLAPSVAIPRIVILTPGSYNETYFEHSYLADYLGFNLVQSGDLMVKNGYVWLKSLDGLSRVDVILRRVDDYFCDPVELKGDSQLGIPGLVEVARRGNVAIANPLGSGILENPALLRFLPQIARHFLGRELRLKSVETWWCGLQEDYNHVLENFEHMVVKSVFRSPSVRSIVVSELQEKERSKLLESIARQPSLYVAQRKLIPSNTPVFNGNQLVSRPALLRTYSVASSSSYQVMPGGLTRAANSENSSLISNQLGSMSKDTWVLASEPEKQTSLRPQGSTEAFLPEDNVLPRRVVENLFWMGRYAERAESSLRLIRMALLQLNNTTISTTARDILLQAVTQVTATYPGFVNSDKLQSHPEEELLSIILDQERTGSVSYCIQSMLTCAEEAKGLMSTDSQRVINDIRDQLSAIKIELESNVLSAPAEALNPLVSSMLALSGIIQGSMIRDIGWRFLDMGQRIESTLFTSNLLRSTMQIQLQEQDEAVVLESLLMMMEGLIAYRHRYQGALNTRNSLELILLDVSNPRSVLYQLNALEQHLNNLPLAPHNKELQGERRCVAEALSIIRLTRLGDLTQSDGSCDTPGHKRANLDQLLSRLHYLLTESSSLLSERFFEKSQGPRQLVDQNWNFE
ncbi:MAG: circularly permuted type 2 ATP-grasp protein [Porticoccaceae bacterium]|nr:circularly permuted type 2 ATP-grasp protein [Pseudomonadales bacterium]MCP5172058.1 circularly permuted type 2 ATP-grasp protein [Pseudomonadales bacterium]